MDRKNHWMGTTREAFTFLLLIASTVESLLLRFRSENLWSLFKKKFVVEKNLEHIL